jgi:hypothetical protein
MITSNMSIEEAARAYADTLGGEHASHLPPNSENGHDADVPEGET